MVDVVAAGVEQQISRLDRIDGDLFSLGRLVPGAPSGADPEVLKDLHRKARAVRPLCKACPAVYIGISQELLCIGHNGCPGGRGQLCASGAGRSQDLLGSVRIPAGTGLAADGSGISRDSSAVQAVGSGTSSVPAAFTASRPGLASNARILTLRRLHRILGNRLLIGVCLDKANLRRGDLR